MGQLLFSQQGCICITFNQSICILPPARLAWIPPLVEHRAEVTGVVGYRSIYLDTHRYSVLPLQLEVLGTTPLLREALERIACADFDTDWEQGAPANILAVYLDEISITQRELTLLPLPSDRRLKHLVGAYAQAASTPSAGSEYRCIGKNQQPYLPQRDRVELSAMVVDQSD